MKLATATSILIYLLTLTPTSSRLVQGQTPASAVKRSPPSRLDNSLNATRTYDERGIGLSIDISNTCILLASDADFRVGAPGAQGNVHLDANSCLCIDGKLTGSVSLSGKSSGSLSGEIVSSTGIELSGAAGTSLALQAFVDNILRLQLGICTQVSVAVGDSNSIHDYQPGVRNGCCRRKCVAGYTPNSSGLCVPITCTDPFIKCGDQCINKNEKQCVSGVPQPKSHTRRQLGVCPSGMTKCPVAGMGWECVNTRTDIEACGGCSFSHDGQMAMEGSDCTSLPNVNEVGCIQGKCHIKSCQRGHELALNAHGNATECVERQSTGTRVIDTPRKGWTEFNIQAITRGL